MEDVVVRLGGPIHFGTDTTSSIVHRQGGSAANVAVAARLAGGAARFIGQVGDDLIGDRLVHTLQAEGVDVVGGRGGRSATVITLLDARGERSMLTDRGSCAELADPRPEWLDGVRVLHVPLYSLVGDPLATTAQTLVDWAHERTIAVSVDTSSSALIRETGAEQVAALFSRLRPDVVFCNADEASALRRACTPEACGAKAVIIKHGANPAFVLRVGEAPLTVSAEVIADVRDTTGAGDAFAAGYLLSMTDGSDTISCVEAGHRVAAATIRRRSADS